MFGPIVAGIGIIGGGAALGIRALRRRPVAADVAAQLKAALQTGGTAALVQLLNAYKAARHPQTGQVEVVTRAAQVSLQKIPSDLQMMYRAALTTGDPGQMLVVATNIRKEPVLANNLKDVARILGGK